MINQQLYSYIVDNLSRGYSVVQIKNYLLNNGYNKVLVSDTLNAVRLNYSQYFQINPNYPSYTNPSNSNNTQNRSNQSFQNNDNTNRINTYITYIKAQVSKGYDLFTIRQYLIKTGYDKFEVDSAIDLYSNNKQTINSNPIFHSNVPNSTNLSSTNNSSNKSQVSNTNSYSDQNSHNFQKVQHEFKVSSSTITKIGIMFLVLIFISFGLFFIFNSDSATLDVILNIDKYTYEPGEEVTFNVNLLNVGSHSKAFDIKLTRTLVNTDTMSQLSSQSDTFALSVSSTKDYSFKLPDTIEPGNYKITISTSYGGMYSASADSTFVVIKKSQPILTEDNFITDTTLDEELIDEVNNQYNAVINNNNNNNNNNYNSLNSNTDFENYLTNIRPDLPKNLDPKFETIITNLRNLASKDNTSIKIAQDSCKALSNSLSSDYCLKEISFVSNKSMSCDLVNNTNTKDQCYLYFVNIGDYTLCNKLTSEDSRSVCLELRNLNMLSQYTGTPMDQTELLSLVNKLNLTSTNSDNSNIINFKEQIGSESVIS